MNTTLTRSAALVGFVLAAGCGRSGESDTAPAAHVDTTNADALDGMSSREVQAQAEALTPEQAAARGIAVDSTIHVENLSSQDSTPPGASAAPPQPGRTGTVPPTAVDSTRGKGNSF
jgi:hypothetical protein